MVVILSFLFPSPFLRFGKKKEEKKEAKAALQRQKSDLMSDHELERLKEERERWGGALQMFCDVSDFPEPGCASVETGFHVLELVCRIRRWT